MHRACRPDEGRLTDNVIAKVPKSAEAEIKAAFWSIFDNIEQAPGERAVAEATRRTDQFAARYRKPYPQGRSPAWKTTWPRR
jgi:hypothetical protein